MQLGVVVPRRGRLWHMWPFCQVLVLPCEAVTLVVAPGHMRSAVLGCYPPGLKQTSRSQWNFVKVCRFVRGGGNVPRVRGPAERTRVVGKVRLVHPGELVPRQSTVSHVYYGMFHGLHAALVVSAGSAACGIRGMRRPGCDGWIGTVSSVIGLVLGEA